jgi:hypothetical protein
MRISATDQYHLHELSSLGWELTVCNALAPKQSPCRRILTGMERTGSICIVSEPFHDMVPSDGPGGGGGYGYLLEDFFDQRPDLSATMIDISPYLLARQEERLSGFDVDSAGRFPAVDMDTLPPSTWPSSTKTGGFPHSGPSRHPS